MSDDVATLRDVERVDELPGEVWEHGTGRTLHAIDDDGGALCDPTWHREPRRVDPEHFRGFRELCRYCFTDELAGKY